MEAAAQTKQNQYFVDRRLEAIKQVRWLAVKAADYSLILSPTQQNKNFVALEGELCYNQSKPAGCLAAAAINGYLEANIS